MSQEQSRPTRIVFFGHSHLTCVREAFVAPGVKASLRTDPVFFQINENVKWLRPIVNLVGGKLEANAAVMYGLRLHGAFSKEDGQGRKVIVSMAGGNEHTILSLLRSGPEPDFVLPQFPDAPRSAQTDLLPFGAVKELVQEKCAGLFAFLQAVRQETDVDFFCVESPPPPASNDWLRENLDTYFRNKIASKQGVEVASPHVRWKFWKLWSMVVEEFCRENGLRYVTTPPELMFDGFLKPEYLSNATHGNTSYGAVVLKTVDRLCSVSEQNGTEA